MALGGVEIGNDMAAEAATAMPMSTVDSPPMIFSLSPMPLHTTDSIGISKADVAVLLIKLERKKHTIPATMSMAIGLHSPKGMDSTATFASPVPFIAKPRAKPPATIQITPQSIS